MRPLRNHGKSPKQTAAALRGSDVILWMTVPVFALLAVLLILQG